MIRNQKSDARKMCFRVFYNIKEVPYCRRILTSINPKDIDDLKEVAMQEGNEFSPESEAYQRYFFETVLPRIPDAECWKKLEVEHPYGFIEVE